MSSAVCGALGTLHANSISMRQGEPSKTHKTRILDTIRNAINSQHLDRPWRDGSDAGGRGRTESNLAVCRPEIWARHNEKVAVCLDSCGRPRDRRRRAPPGAAEGAIGASDGNGALVEFGALRLDLRKVPLSELKR
ncbi:hypothetical protein EVAR_14040_1 [Eumeta japonica]|uniref:Uncharacterized protein n=1 Tax=Eumeta variegata TaxID=151549 RepID=A0A4C1UPF0_EUMVA|nr:hypothetical protein EVAR_14040_1 [Eumeta japonica]